MSASPLADWRSPRAAALAAAQEQALDWLETQSRIAAFWRDQLADLAGDPDLVAAIDREADWMHATLVRVRNL